MNSIKIKVTDLIKKISAISEDNMEIVEISICDEVVDQSKISPGFLHFIAYTRDGVIDDYESVDAVSIFEED